MTLPWVDVTGFCNDNTIPKAVNGTLILDQAAPLGKIKIPQDKEILITLSAQINIFTLNTATSKKGREDEFYGNIGATSAMAGVDVRLYAIPEGGGNSTLCEPGQVTMASVTMASRDVELRNRGLEPTLPTKTVLSTLSPRTA